ncbi:hypothetical protein AK812_SmicGene11305 [Symbiodinium microadriaticum]|uniref:Uncharacterized protein n=1 Tax=Symbiodinium microadriaticum TaxID=2951 RepID=A0A1Q9EDI5_SYMMI|nr:hypothetical protein AK812_SmicGene11305 [Symbiodinium microadriaticum]
MGGALSEKDVGSWGWGSRLESYVTGDRRSFVPWLGSVGGYRAQLNLDIQLGETEEQERATRLEESDSVGAAKAEQMPEEASAMVAAYCSRVSQRSLWKVVIQKHKKEGTEADSEASGKGLCGRSYRIEESGSGSVLEAISLMYS